MLNTIPSISAERWTLQMFSARAAAGGGIVRRKTSDVERILGRIRFLREVEKRGYHVIENAGQFVIFCNQETLHILA